MEVLFVSHDPPLRLNALRVSDARNAVSVQSCGRNEPRSGASDEGSGETSDEASDETSGESEGRRQRHRKVSLVVLQEKHVSLIYR